jgi:hypothetical protein
MVEAKKWSDSSNVGECLVFVCVEFFNILLQQHSGSSIFGLSSLLINEMLFFFNLEQNINIYLWLRVVVFNATFNNISVISWRLVSLVEEIGVPGENQRPATSH